MTDLPATTERSGAPGWSDSFAEDFAKLIASAQQRQRVIRAYEGLLKAEAMSVDELRALWDSIGDSGDLATSDPEISGETVHFVLNQKGDGHYCAV